MADELVTASTMSWCSDGRKVVTVRLHGDVDLSTQTTLRDAVGRALAVAAVSGIVIDLEQVTFLDSSGISVLVGARGAAAGRGVTIRVVKPQAAVERALRITGVFDVLTADRP